MVGGGIRVDLTERSAVVIVPKGKTRTWHARVPEEDPGALACLGLDSAEPTA